MFTVFNENWLAQNENRAYPLAFDAQAEDVTGSFLVPNSLLLAMQVSVPALDTIDPAKFFMSSIILTASGMTLKISYDNGGSYLLVGSAIVPFDSHVPRNSYALSGANDFDDVTGKVVVGKIDNLPAGQFNFTPAGGKLDPDVCRPFLRGIRALLLQNSDDQAIELTGIISISSGTNLRFTVDGAETETPTVRIDAISGDGLNQGCACEIQVGNPILTINNVRPTPAGDFSVIGSDAIDITAVTNGIQITNTKAKPCCGCVELENLTQRLELFGTAKATLESFAARLEGEVSNTLNNLLGSKLNDVPRDTIMDRSGPPDGGLEYPFVNPTPDIAGKLTDFHLDYDGDPAVLPFRIAGLDGIGQYWEMNSSSSRESNTSTFGRPELIVVDGSNRVILDTRSVPSHRTRSWGSFLIHEWMGNNVVCLAAAPPASVSGMPERMEPDSSILDERTWYQPKKRVRKLIVDGQELTGKITILGGYNTVITPSSGALSAAGRSLLAATSPFDPVKVFMSAEAGSGAGRFPDCSDDNPPIRRVNNQQGDTARNITFGGHDCIVVTEPMTYNVDTVTPTPASILISDSCGPCCDCSDYERVALGMRRLWDSFKAIGSRLESIRDDYRTIRDRMVSAQECIAANPLRIVPFASKNRVVDMNILLCNNTGDCKYKVRLLVTFTHLRRQYGTFDDASYFATDPDTGVMVQYPAIDTGVGYPYPSFYHEWTHLRPNQTGRVRIRLQFDNFQPHDNLTIDATNTIAGTYGIATANTVVDIRS